MNIPMVILKRFINILWSQKQADFHFTTWIDTRLCRRMCGSNRVSGGCRWEGSHRQTQGYKPQVRGWAGGEKPGGGIAIGRAWSFWGSGHGGQSASVEKLTGLSSQVLLGLVGWNRSLGNWSSVAGGIFNCSSSCRYFNCR